MNRKYEIQIVRMHDVVQIVGYSQSTIYDLISKGKFPAPFKLVKGGRAAGWFKKTIEDWLVQRSKEGKL
jgi:prophage regulatory protein